MFPAPAALVFLGRRSTPTLCLSREQRYSCGRFACVNVRARCMRREAPRTCKHAASRERREAAVLFNGRARGKHRRLKCCARSIVRTLAGVRGYASSNVVEAPLSRAVRAAIAARCEPHARSKRRRYRPSVEHSYPLERFELAPCLFKGSIQLHAGGADA